jgi:hypothetical protein
MMWIESRHRRMERSTLSSTPGHANVINKYSTVLEKLVNEEKES